MPRKRVSSKKRVAELANSQLWNLILHDGEYLGYRDRPDFIDQKHRRAAWECNRDIIMADHLAGLPGSRPGAWWTYDCPKVERLPDETDFEFLIRTGCADQQERDAIFRQWSLELKARASALRGNLESGQHGYTLNDYRRQAAVLEGCGYPAGELLRRCITMQLVETHVEGGD